jgi:hypothetical protein
MSGEDGMDAGAHAHHARELHRVADEVPPFVRS